MKKLNLTASETQEFINYLKATGYTFEVEEANNKYKNLVKDIDGIFIDSPHYYKIENKWGCECRLYFYDFENFPKLIREKIVSSYGYGGEKGGKIGKYTIRINDTDFLLRLVKKYNFRVGEYSPKQFFIKKK